MAAGTSHTRITGWVGWIWFAAALLVLNGTFNLIDGLVSLFKHRVYVQPSGSLVVFNYTAWGWILLLIGILQVLAGFALFAGKFWARVVAVALTMLSAIAQITFITAYPLWSFIVIIVDVVVLWALFVHGEEAQEAAEL
jgi:hypothetical protein